MIIDRTIRHYHNMSTNINRRNFVPRNRIEFYKHSRQVPQYINKLKFNKFRKGNSKKNSDLTNIANN